MVTQGRKGGHGVAKSEQIQNIKKNFLLSIFFAWVTTVTDGTWSETPKSEGLARSEQN